MKPHNPNQISAAGMTRPRYNPRDWASNPPLIHRDYKSTRLRGPTRPLLPLPATLSERTGPVFGADILAPLDHDLTRNAVKNGEPLGERMILDGRVLDENHEPVAGALVEIWQANAAGRYAHRVDGHDAPLDPNFLGAGRTVTGIDGRYRFRTIKPGAYPWGNHDNAWRPNHIHVSVLGSCIATRLVTQMYFPGDPLLDLDPIFLAVPADARERLIADFSIDLTEPGIALGYVFDIVLRGERRTPGED